MNVAVATQSTTRLSVPTRMRQGQPVTAAEGRDLVRSYRQTAAIRARNAGSKIAELLAYAKRGGLNAKQLADVAATVRNMTPLAVEFARVAIDARTPQPATRAYTCVDCRRQQDIDGNCIVCGLPVVASEAAA